VEVSTGCDFSPLAANVEVLHDPLVADPGAAFHHLVCRRRGRSGRVPRRL